MTPKEKSQELIEKYCQILFGDEQIVNITHPKKCALIAVDEMLVEIEMMKLLKELKSTKRYLSFWQQVKDEINNL